MIGTVGQRLAWLGARARQHSKILVIIIVVAESVDRVQSAL